VAWDSKSVDGVESVITFLLFFVRLLTYLHCFLLAFPLPVARDVMLLHQQKETLDQIVLDPATHAAAAASQSRLALAPFRVQALHDTGSSDLASTFVNGPVLIRTEKTRVGLVTVGDDRLVLVILGHIGPAPRQRVPVSLAKREAQHLLDPT
jgi:hypothetical protein